MDNKPVKDKIFTADCFSHMSKLKSGSFDHCITDPPYNISGYDGTDGTGGGGGGCRSTPTATIGGAGGSGGVVIRFADSVTPAATTGNPTITTSGGYKEYWFKTAGSASITF